MWIDYAIAHPRLDVIAIVTAESSLAAMNVLMARDQSWGDLGLGEAVYLGRSKGRREHYSLWGQESCDEDRRGVTMQQVISVVKERRGK